MKLSRSSAFVRGVASLFFFVVCSSASPKTANAAVRVGQGSLPHASLRASHVGSFANVGEAWNSLADEVLHPVEDPNLLYELAFHPARFSHEEIEEEQRSSEIPKVRQQLYFRPVSVTLNCVMALTIQCLVIYTALAAMRNYDELSGRTQPSLLTETLTAAARSTQYPPMMCMLFVACRMYVLATTEGLGEPQPWVKGCMITASLGMTLQFILVLNLPFATDRSNLPPDVRFSDLTGEQCDIHPKLTDHKFVNRASKYAVYAGQLVCMGLLYGGVTGVIVGVATFSEGTRQVSPAVKCTLFLTALYFAVFFFLWLIRARAEWTGPPLPFSPEGRRDRAINGAALCASMAVRKAPMLAVLFLGARMRALQLDPPDGVVPLWAQITFFTTTGALFLEVATSAYIGFVGEAMVGYYGTYVYTTKRATHIVQHTFAIVVFLGLVATIIAIFFQGPPRADGTTARYLLSPTMVAVIQLNSLFFFVAFGQELCFMSRDVFGKSSKMLMDTLIASTVSTNFCPLLCVLFLGCRMRALQITQQKGAPPRWAQDSMYMCVFATFIQVFCCLALPIFTGLATEVDGDGNAKLDLRPMVGAYAVTAVKYVALFFLHGGVITVCVAVFVMTPESCAIHEEGFNTMQSVIRGIAITMIVLLISLVLSSAKVIGLAIKLGIESADETLLGTQIRVGTVALSICRGYVNIGSLVVENPEDCGFTSPYLLNVGKVTVKVNIWRLIKTLGKEFELTRLQVQGAQVIFEKDFFDSSKPSNVDVIVNHLNSLAGEPAPEDPTKPKEEKPKPEDKPTPEEKPKDDNEKEEFVPQVEVHAIEITDIEATVMSNDKRIATAMLADIVYEDFMTEVVSGDGNVSKGKVAGILVATILQTLLKTCMGNSGIVIELAKLGTQVAAQKMADKAAGLWTSVFGSSTEES